MEQQAFPQRVPPSPDVMLYHYMNYRRLARELGVSFAKYLKIIGFEDPSVNNEGMDDGIRYKVKNGTLDMITVPTQQVVGPLELIVLLVDFPDNIGQRPAHEFEEMLFSEDVYPTGSLRDYYREVTLGKVDVTGTVHGWLRLPQDYSYYTNKQSGMGTKESTQYPHNAQRMAEDAVAEALKQGVKFSQTLDKFGQGAVTALFIVHAGIGAETIKDKKEAANHIWSHKWNMPNPASVGGGLSATTYLTVPENCRMGVCAHELGHLAFQWGDFYDPNYDEDGHYWDGSGKWDLMAGGSWNGNGNRPAHPAGLHKSQHGWVELQKVSATAIGIEIPPYGANFGKVVRIQSAAFAKDQFLILENRSRAGFDNQLPKEGLLVWRVDISKLMNSPVDPGMKLVQADGRNDLDDPTDYNQGDEGDPFPGSANRISLSDSGVISTSFPGGKLSGFKLDNIRRDQNSGSIFLDVVFSGAAEPVKKAKAFGKKSTATPK